MTRSTLFSPFIVVTLCVSAGAMRDYSRGEAVLHPETCRGICGRPSFDPAWSIDTRTRLPIVSRMPRNGASRFMWRINDRVVRVLSRALGPQRGSYTGALPTRAAAGKALAEGRLATIAELAAAPDLACYASQRPSAEPISWFGFVVAPEIGGRAVRRAELDGLVVLGTGVDFFVLVDPATNREVARYGDPSR
jgi:hypothetical protein